MLQNNLSPHHYKLLLRSQVMILEVPHAANLSQLLRVLGLGCIAMEMYRISAYRFLNPNFSQFQVKAAELTLIWV